MRFRSYLLGENTVAQELRRYVDTKRLQATKNTAWGEVRAYLPQLVAQGKDMSRLVNWLSYHFLVGAFGTPDPMQMRWVVQNFAAFITGAWEQLQGKFNDPRYDEARLNHDDHEYHQNLAKRGGGAGAADGEAVVRAGAYQWVRLPRGYCPQEAKAMGHCGNEGGRSGDTIFSLRDAKNHAHLTFIVNKGILGEGKGRGNAKPGAKYHPAIAALLAAKDPATALPYIGYIEGGGYLPRNNFYLQDFAPGLRGEVEKKNPYLLKPLGYFLRTGNVEKVREDLDLPIEVKDGWVHLVNPVSGEDVMGQVGQRAGSVRQCYGDYRYRRHHPQWDFEDVEFHRRADRERFYECAHKENPWWVPDERVFEAALEALKGREDDWGEAFEALLSSAWGNAVGAKRQGLDRAWHRFIDDKHTKEGFRFAVGVAVISIEDFERLPQHKDLQDYLPGDELWDQFVRGPGFAVIRTAYLSEIRQLSKEGSPRRRKRTGEEKEYYAGGF